MCGRYSLHSFFFHLVDWAGLLESRDGADWVVPHQVTRETCSISVLFLTMGHTCLVATTPFCVQLLFYFILFFLTMFGTLSCSLWANPRDISMSRVRRRMFTCFLSCSLCLPQCTITFSLNVPVHIHSDHPCPCVFVIRPLSSLSRAVVN